MEEHVSRWAERHARQRLARLQRLGDEPRHPYAASLEMAASSGGTGGWAAWSP